MPSGRLRHVPLSLVEKYTGHVSSRVRKCPAPWGMSAQEHTFTFCQIFFISGGNYTLITCIQYTTMVTHSECEISQSWRTQFSSHGALNLNRVVMPPPSPTLYVYQENFRFCCNFRRPLAKSVTKCLFFLCVLFASSTAKPPDIVLKWVEHACVHHTLLQLRLPRPRLQGQPARLG